MKTFVITGGPSIGKTTLIEILASRGYAVVPEAARMVIMEAIARGDDIVALKKTPEFQEEIARRQLELEAKVAGDAAFADRSVIDGIAYCRISDVPVPKIIEEVGRRRYDKIFILDPLGIYEDDGVRTRTLEDAARIHQEIGKAYREFGYEPIMVPVLPPEARADFVLERI